MLRDHLCTFSGCRTQCPAENLLDHIWQQADRNEKNDAEPGWTAGQHLHENVVHPLVVQERPGQKQQRQDVVSYLFTKRKGYTKTYLNGNKVDYTK